jgi:hypothetical protein
MNSHRLHLNTWTLTGCTLTHFTLPANANCLTAVPHCNSPGLTNSAIQLFLSHECCNVQAYNTSVFEWRDIHGVSKRFSEWYQKTNKTEDTNKLTSLAFKIIVILHNTLLATFIKLPEALWTLPIMCCEGWRLFWRPIKLICLYFCFVCFLVPFTKLFRHTMYNSRKKVVSCKWLPHHSG